MREYVPTSGARVPINWCAPEVLTSLKFSNKSDVYAFGGTSTL